MNETESQNLKNFGLDMLRKMIDVDSTPPSSDEKIPSNVESKYRKRWWFGKVVLSFSFVIPYIEDDDLKNKLTEAIVLWTDDGFTKRSRPTYHEDIKKADLLIKEVLNYFDK